MLSEFCIPFVKVGGSFVALKGPSENIKDGEKAMELLGGCVSRETNYSVEDEQRKIVIVKKNSHTPTKYPRNSGQIKKNPL